MTTERRNNETVEERLARLRDATAALSPPAGLAARLAARTRAPRRGVAGVVLPFGQRALFAAALAAAASVALALHTEQQTDDVLSDIDGVSWEP